MDIQALLKQAKKMQKDLAKAESELKEKEYTASVGGGAVKVSVNGNTEITEMSIDDALLNTDSKDELIDMITMAVNDAMKQANKDREDTMSAMTGGVKMPGVF